MSMTVEKIISIEKTIRLYGKEITDIGLGQKIGIGLESDGQTVSFALVRAISAANFCKELPSPIILAVPGKGLEPLPDDTCAEKGDLVWSIGRNTETLHLSLNRGDVLSLVDEAEIESIKGGLRFESIRIESGSIRGTAHAWYEIKILGEKVKDSKRFDFSIPISGCHTIFDFGIGEVKACLSPVSGGVQLCGELCVGKWGISKCWKECQVVVFGGEASTEQGAQKSGKGCGCNNH